MPQTIDVAVFGNSLAEYALLQAPGNRVLFNFALPGQELVYDAALMRQYRQHIPQGGIVVLMIGYYCRYAPVRNAEFEEMQGRYYRILDPENILDVDRPWYYLQKLFPVLGLEPFQLLRSAMIGLGLREMDPIGIDVRAEMVVTADEIPVQQQERRQGHWEDLIKPIFPQTDADEDAALRQMLDMAKENGWQAVLVTPPFLDAYNACFPVEFYPVFAQQMKDLAAEYGVPYLDYSHDEAWGQRLDRHFDINHMNAAGAAAFCEQFYGDLEAMGLLDG